MNHMSNKTFDMYISNYVGKRDIELDKALSSVTSLVDDNVITEELGKKLVKILLVHHLQNEIYDQIRATHWIKDNNQWRLGIS